MSSPSKCFVTDLHPGAQRAHGRKFLDGKPDRLRCGRKAAIVQRLSWPTLALAHEQLGGYAVVECHSLAVGRHMDVPTRLVSVRVSARPDDGVGKLAYLPSRAATSYAQPRRVYKSRLSSLSLTSRSCGSSELLMRY